MAAADADPVAVSPMPPASSASSSARPLAPDFAGDVEARKRYGVAALEIVGFDVLLNQANRRWSGSSDYDSNLSTIAATCAAAGASTTIRSTSTSSRIRTRARSITAWRGRRG